MLGRDTVAVLVTAFTVPRSQQIRRGLLRLMSGTRRVAHVAQAKFKFSHVKGGGTCCITNCPGACTLACRVRLGRPRSSGLIGMYNNRR